MSLAKGEWENKQEQGTHQSFFCVVLLSLVKHDFNVLVLETKQKLVVFNFHLKQEHAETTVFSLWLFCIGRNSLHCFVNVELGILGTLPLPCIMPVFQSYMWHKTKSVPECPCVISGSRKGYCLKLGILCCGSLLGIEVQFVMVGLH